MSSQQLTLPNEYSRPITRACVLVLLLVCEILFLQLRYDGAAFVDDPTLSAYVLVNSKWLVRFGLSFVVGYIVITGSQIGQSYQAFATQFTPPPIRNYVVHFMAFAGLAWQSSVVFNRVQLTPLTVSIWTLAVVAVGGTWGVCVLPVSGWFHFVRHRVQRLLVAGAIATTACLLGAICTSPWDDLAAGTLLLSCGILTTFFENVTCDFNSRYLGIGDFGVEISPDCSGYEGVGLVTLFLTAYLWKFRSRFKFPNAYALLLIGVLICWCANSLRIAALVVIGAFISPSLALQSFHSQAGWILVCAITLGILSIAQRTSFFITGNDFCPLVRSAIPSTAYLQPFLWVTFSGMLTDAMGMPETMACLVHGGVMMISLGSIRSHFCNSEISHYAYVTPIALGLFGCVLWICLVSPPLHSVEVYEVALTGSAIAALGSRLCLYTLLAPLVEELAFRKYLIDRLQITMQGSMGRYSTAASFIVSTALFGAMHGSLFIPALVVGVLFGAAYLLRKSVWDAIIAHAVCNASIAVYVLITRHWWLLG
ncbi:MAG: exosortase E/protease, VPEID-CTERM system [Blastopirellula sp.]|nr:MAG: exosortase E/protease, VPEID-CTERM system [Blastopirellula sp.]